MLKPHTHNQTHIIIRNKPIWGIPFTKSAYKNMGYCHIARILTSLAQEISQRNHSKFLTKQKSQQKTNKTI